MKCIYLATFLAFGGPVAAAVAPAALTSSSESYSAVPDTSLKVPGSGTIRVAIVISDRFNLMDLAGPLHTFAKVQLPPYGDDGKWPFKTFTVAETRKPVTSYGNLQVTPNYTFADAPDADIVVVGAQSGGDESYLGYLRRMSAHDKVVMSVCTGVAQLAKAGLLDGKVATTHHNYVDELGRAFPKVKFVPDLAYVRSAPLLFTAGGETSGIELSLHIIELYYGHDVAVRTARSMEYRGPRWQG
jgi:transcriptional regulator GlxA family with amidase domain